MKRAVLKSLPLDKFHMTFADTIIEGVDDGDRATVEIFLDIYTQKLLWDVANILEGGLLIKDVDEFSVVLPTIATCIGNIHLKRIVDHHTRSSDANDHYHTTRTADVMSRLLARFNCVARSKDLNPIKSSSRYVQRALQEAIGRLEDEWSLCIDDDKQKEEYKAVKTSAKEYIKRKHGIFALRIIESRWLHALLYVCSYRNRKKYSDIQETVHKLCEMEENGYEKLCEFIVPLKLVLSEDTCLLMQRQVDQDQLAASNLLESINATRVRGTIKTEKKTKKKKKRDKKKNKKKGKYIHKKKQRRGKLKNKK